MYFIKMIGKSDRSGLSAVDQSILGQPPGDRWMPGGLCFAVAWSNAI